MNISPAAIALNIAAFKSQAMSSLVSSSLDTGNDDLSALLNPFSDPDGVSSTDPLSWLSVSRSVAGNLNLPGAAGTADWFGSAVSGSVAGVSATAGRNMELTDPESAYKMMSVINAAEVSYKARFSELSQMKVHVSQMEDAGVSLGSLTTSTGNDRIEAQLQDFVTQYNNWIQRFDPDMQNGGILAGTQAAQVSRFELKQQIENIFYGVKDGVHGLGDLGVTIDPNTRLASLDVTRLKSVLAGNKPGAVSALQEFGANFAKSANLVNSGGNFIPNQLDNLSRAIHFIDDNEASLREEFGTGSMAKPTGLVAQALAAYNQIYGF